MLYYTYTVVRTASAYAAVLGFFVPYFDLDVILLPTPPCALLVTHDPAIV
jgi:hypothetical protein